jgi:type I restriction enzyme S subunit
MSEFPPDWGEHLLGDIAEVINGRAYKLSEWEEVGTPVIRLQNLTQGGGSFYYSNLTLPEKQYCRKGDLLYMWSASFGPHIWWSKKAIFHYHIWKIEPRPRLVDKKYLYYLLDAKTQDWKSTGSGMAMIHLTKAGFEKEILALPPLPEQKKIAEMLAGIDSFAKRLRDLHQKKQELLRSLSLSLLGIGHCHSRFHYQSMPLGNCLRLSRGVDVTKARMVPGPYPVISSSGISGWHDSFTHETEGVVVGRKGSIGNVHYAETAHWVHDTSLGIADYKGNHKRYIYHLLKNLDLANYGTASGSPSLNRNDVHPIAINLPSHADQIQIASILDAEESACRRLKKKIFTVEYLKSSVASDLLSGRKRVTV